MKFSSSTFCRFIDVKIPANHSQTEYFKLYVKFGEGIRRHLHIDKVHKNKIHFIYF